MAEERPYRDTVTLPSVLVMAGDPWPSDFYARYPHAFRVPVQVVWREGTLRDSAPLPARGETVAGRPPAGDPALPVAKAGAPGGAVAEVPSAGSSDRGGDPVGTFLRINDTLDRAAGKPASIARSDGPERDRFKSDHERPLSRTAGEGRGEGSGPRREEAARNDGSKFSPVGRIDA